MFLKLYENIENTLKNIDNQEMLIQFRGTIK